MLRIAPFVFLFITWQVASSQIGGGSTYRFLDLATHTRVAALGGKIAALDESDLGASFVNPSLLRSDLHNQLSLSYVSYFDDIRYGIVSYARTLNKYGNVAIGLQHVSHGNFIQADETGIITGSFSGYDMALHLQYSYTIDSAFTFGLTLKPIYSHLEQYRSFGLATDLGASYQGPHRLFNASVVVRNLGTMVTPYTADTYEPLPFELVAGISQKLKHAPFRFVITFQQIQEFNLYYKRKKESSAFFGDTNADKPSRFEELGNELLSHLILGVEFVPVKNFYFRGGYNFQRRNELKIEEKASTVGFSWGIGIKINRFHISFSRATYHLAGASSHFSLGTNLDDFFTRSKL